MPLSLRDYIQETGRGGRDNKPSYCVLFFSHFDRGKAENVIGLSAGGSKHLQGEARTAAERHLKAVIYYATTGDKCRYSMLAECATLEEAAFPSRQECKQKCDNCAWKTSSVDLDEWFQPFLGQPRTLLSTGGGSSLQFSYCKREVTSVIADCLSQVLDQARRQSLTTEDEAEKCMRQIIGERVHQETCKELRMILFALLRTEGKSDSNKSLVTDLLRFLRTKNNKQQTTTDWPRMQSVLEAIRDKDTKFYIQNVKLLHTTISTKASVVLDVEGMPSSETLSWCDGTSHIHVAEATASFPDVIYRGMPDPWRRDDWVGGVPFLIHYEICR
jgi:superfamily II DNA helicase RecQ